jgi:ABC-type sugar transport system ATPase subunit
VLVVSTDFAELASLCGRVLVVRGGGLVAELSADLSPERILAEVTGDVAA